MTKAELEKEAEEYRESKRHKSFRADVGTVQINYESYLNNLQSAYKDGAEFGYNKANEWHYVANDDLPKVDNKIVLCVCGDGYYVDGKRHYTLKLLTRKEFSLFQPVYAWKEIVLPELKESE